MGGSTRPLVRPWRSPPDQPRWARPALLAIAALAALGYAWGMNGAALEVFYGAAARSMSMSWHNFFFGAFDPLGTVTIDKLPGSLWPQALSLRIFGFHTWALVLPQVIEGTLTVLVLYRTVRRLAGPIGGITAAAVLAASPVTVALNRGNVADSLLILLLVLAADATTVALTSGRRGPLLLAGFWVGLAFQAKMTVAWLVLPALAAAYLLAAPPGLRTRVTHVLLAGAVTLLVSLSWMSVVSLVPTHDRPYVDGTQNDSLYSQVFDYNGVARLRRGNVFAGAGHPSPFLVRLSEANASAAHREQPSWHRLLSGLFGREDGWLLPAALLAGLLVLLTSTRADRRDPLRASVVLWGTWLVLFAAFFSAGGYPNPYYVATLSPAIGGLCGAGLALFCAARQQRSAGPWLLAALFGCVGYGVYLTSDGSGVPGWLLPVSLAATILAGGWLMAASVRPEWRSARRRAPSSRLAALGAGPLPTLAAMLVLPAVASALMVTRGLGPFAAPYEPASATTSRGQAAASRQLDEQIVGELHSTFGTEITFATDSSILAAPYIFSTGKEILPIGGYQGGIPAPSLARLRSYIIQGRLRAVIAPKAPGPDVRITWVQDHCSPLAGSGHGKATIAVYDCGHAPGAAPTQ